MQLASSSHIPDGLLAAMTLLNEKPRHGVANKNVASNPGIDERNSTVAIGLRAGLHLEAVRESERARNYSSNDARWLTPDWSSYPEAVPYAKLKNPQSLNLYEYMLDNPLGGVDEDGHACILGVTVFGSWFGGRCPGSSTPAPTPVTPPNPPNSGQQFKVDQFGNIVPPSTCACTQSNNQQQSSNHQRNTNNKETDSSTPTGRRGNPMKVKRGTNLPEVINGRQFTGHALDQMQGRGIPSSVVEEVITNGKPGLGNDVGTFTHTSDGVQVITNSDGDVITVKTVSGKL